MVSYIRPRDDFGGGGKDDNPLYGMIVLLLCFVALHADEMVRNGCLLQLFFSWSGSRSG